MKLKEAIDIFHKQTEPEHRYSSFDYCYTYFKTTQDLTFDMEKSCLVIGQFLASWGMYRGSGFLLQKSVRHYIPIVNYLNTLDKKLWTIDVNSYDDSTIDEIIILYKEIKSRVIPNSESDLVLVTKIMLGVFGFTPAYDQYFCNTFREIPNKRNCRFRRFNKDSLKSISDFYVENKEIIDNYHSQIKAKDFNTGLETDIHYPRAKIIDMYGFQVGLSKSKK